jgi:hypothetical protein
MIWNLIWIIGIISFVCCLIKKYKDNDLNFEEGFMALLMALCIAGLTAFCCLIVFSIVECASNKEYIKTHENKIYCSNNDNKYLVQEEGTSKNYKIYLKDDKASFIEVAQKNTNIFEDNDTYINEFTEYYTNNFVKFLIGDTTMSDKKYEIHIPKDSISVENRTELK